MADPLRVALVVERFGGPGGTEKYVADLEGWLTSRGHEVDVWACRAEGQPRLRRLDLRGRARGLLGLVGFLRATNRVPLGDYDVVQGFGRSVNHHFYRAGGGVHAAWLAARDRHWLQRLRSRVSPLDHLERWIDRRAITGARIVICNSQMAGRQVVAWHGVPEERVRVVRNGVDLARFKPDEAARSEARRQIGVPEGGRVALFVANGFKRKGLDVAAAAFEVVAGADDRLVIIGSDSRAVRRVAPIGRRLGDRCVHLGSRSDPEAWIPGADATILPTLYDAAANTTLESLACAVPPVTSGRDGNAEIVPDPALVVDDPMDVAGFARALRYAWEGGPELAARCRKAAEVWPVSRNGEAMESLYREWRDG